MWNTGPIEYRSVVVWKQLYLIAIKYGAESQDYQLKESSVNSAMKKMVAKVVLPRKSLKNYLKNGNNYSDRLYVSGESAKN